MSYAVYFYAKLYDNEPEKIMRELAKRDGFGSADFFGVIINGNNDGQQDFEFFVTAANCQGDANESASGEDFSWDAVWESEVAITDFGWVVEMKIPYAALRFPPSKIQTWGINFFRNIQLIYLAKQHFCDLVGSVFVWVQIKDFFIKKFCTSIIIV